MSSVKKNYLYNIIYEALLIIIPIITSPYISRILGAESVGIYTYCYTQVSFFVLFARLGIVNHGSRSIAAAKTNEERNVIFSNTYTIQLFLSALATLAYLFYLLVFQVECLEISFIMLIYLFAATFDINWFYFGIEKFKITVIRNVIVKIISTVLLFIVVKRREDLWKYALILGMSQLSGQLAIWPYLRRYVRFIKPSMKIMKTLFVPILLLFIPQIAVSIYKMMDKMMLGSYCVKEELGYYEYASMIVVLPLGFITSLGTVMLPRISSLMKNGNIEKSQTYTHFSILFAVGMSVAFAFGLSSIAPVFVPFYFGTEFIPVSSLLLGLSSTLPLIAWANVVRTQFLIPLNKDKEYIFSLFCGAFINIIINLILIPKMQAWGAVVGTIFAEASVCLIQTYMSKKYIPVIKYLKEIFGFLIIGMIMFVLVRLVACIKINTVYSIVLQVIIGAISYILLSFLYVKLFLRINIIKSI